MRRRMAIAALAAAVLLALTGCKTEPVTDLVIKDGTISIRDDCYRNNAALETVVIPDSVICVGARAFYGCENLRDVTLPASAEYPNPIFADNPKLTTLTITGDRFTPPPDYVTDYSFIALTTDGVNYKHDLRNTLEHLKIAGSIEAIPSRAFASCTNLTLLELSDAVRSIGPAAFAGCSRLETVALPDALTTIGASAFSKSGLTSVAIPASVESIGESAFDGCEHLESVALPDALTTIGESAFVGCEHLESVALPDALTTIEAYAFSQSGLTSIEIPASVESIGESAFAGCEHLESVALPDTPTTIEARAFANCPNITSVTIPPSVETIGADVFAGCTALSESVRDIFPADFERAEDVSDGEGKLIPEGARVVPMGSSNLLDGPLYSQMPEDVRSADWFTADYALVLKSEFYYDTSVTIITTYSYGGYSVLPDSHVFYNIYLCGRDGTIRLIDSSHSDDPEVVWKRIADRF